MNKEHVCKDEDRLPIYDEYDEIEAVQCMTCGKTEPTMKVEGGLEDDD